MRQQAQFRLSKPWPAPAPRRGELQERVSLVGCTPDGLLRLACLGELGHQVIGVSDAEIGTFDPDTWDSLDDEPYLATMLEDAADLGLLRLGFDLDMSVAVTDATLVCADVPLARDGSSDLRQLEVVVESLGRAMAAKGGYHTVIVCSAVPPGTTMGMIVPRLEQASGGTLGDDFGVAVWTLPVARGRAVDEFFAQERAVFGASDRRSAQQMFALLADLDCELVRCDVLTAEFSYYATKAWHALQGRFAEEVAILGAAMGIDGREPLALRGRRGEDGMAFGRCDALGALGHFARCLHVDTPTIRTLTGGEVVPWPAPAGGSWRLRN